MPIKLIKKLLAGLKRLLLYFLFAFVASSLLMVMVFRYFPVPITTFMLYRHMVDFQDKKDFIAMNHHWVNSDNISKHASIAVIAAEDQRFYIHNGYDVEAMTLAIETWLDGGRLRGASTISQQLAKNLFLIPARSFWRKGFEIWFTVLIETFWSKERILEVYLNSVEFGDHLFGIEAASRHYFGISALQLSKQQSALLAASLPNPIRFNVARPTRYMLKRRAWILHQMSYIDY